MELAAEHVPQAEIILARTVSGELTELCGYWLMGQ
jgi:hypothetical protein